MPAALARGLEASSCRAVAGGQTRPRRWRLTRPPRPWRTTKRPPPKRPVWVSAGGQRRGEGDGAGAGLHHTAHLHLCAFVEWSEAALSPPAHEHGAAAWLERHAAREVGRRRLGRRRPLPRRQRGRRTGGQGGEALVGAARGSLLVRGNHAVVVGGGGLQPAHRDVHELPALAAARRADGGLGAVSRGLAVLEAVGRGAVVGVHVAAQQRSVHVHLVGGRGDHARLIVVVRAGDAREREQQNHTKRRNYPTSAHHVPYIGGSTRPTRWDIRPLRSVRHRGQALVSRAYGRPRRLMRTSTPAAACSR